MDQPQQQIQCLPRSDSLRGQLLQAATADTVAEHGYRATTISDIAKRAGLSRRSLPRELSSKDQCFLATFDRFAQQLYARLISTYRRFAQEQSNEGAALRSAVDTLMAILTAQRSSSWLCLVEAPGASRAALERCESAAAYMANLLTTAAELFEDDRPIAPAIAEAIVAGIWHVAHSYLATESSDSPSVLADELSSWALGYGAHPFSHAARNTEMLLPKPRPSPSEGRDIQARQATRLATGKRQGPRPAPKTTREVILRATATAVSARGYHVATVGDITSLAGITPRTFYRYFPSKADAVLSAHDQWIGQVTALAVSSYGRADSSPTGVREAIASFVRALDEDPEMAHLAMVDVLALGAAGRACQDRAITELMSALELGTSCEREVTVRASVGAVWGTLRSYTLRSQAHPQPDPTARLTYIALGPFIGMDAAASLA